MQGFNEFIIEVGKAFRDTVKHGSLELYIEYSHRQQEQSNRYGKVISLPMKEQTDIEVGAEVIIDPTVLFEQVYQGKLQESRFLVDAEKGWYRVTADMIILYKNPNQERYFGHRFNLFGTPIKTELKQTASGIVLTKALNQTENMIEVAYANKDLIEKEGINVGDRVHHVPNRTWMFELEGKQYLYLRNMDLLAKAE
jgi:co-chaperonin GroES (HSP10)